MNRRSTAVQGVESDGGWPSPRKDSPPYQLGDTGPRQAATFSIIVADPPWRFASNSDKKPGRNARRHYDCMTGTEIQALDIPAAKDAILFMWATIPHLHTAIATFPAWGFKYKSGLVWVKDRIATGYWARNRHELVLIGTRGKFPCPKPAPFPDSVLEGQQRQHSRKPDVLQDQIDAVWPDHSKLEMFARQERQGWCAWGNETGKFEATP